jgi:hypothetical protein
VENQGKLMPKSETGWSEGEEGISPDLLAVRSALRGLPKLECSTGFDYRLQRKLNGEEPGVRRAGSPRSWTLGWAGAGLGFATAMAIAFFAFDLGGHGVVPTVAPIAGAASGGPAMPAPMTVSSVPANDQQAGIPRLTAEEKPVAVAKKDTLPPANKADIRQDLIHTTGAGQR